MHREQYVIPVHNCPKLLSSCSKAEYVVSNTTDEIVRLTAEKQKATRKGRKRTSVKSCEYITNTCMIEIVVDCFCVRSWVHAVADSLSENWARSE